MAITTRIIAQQVTALDGANSRVSKSPKFIVQLGYSVSSLAATELLDAASRAATSASAAKTSETNSKTSETNSKSSETKAKTSETNAAASAQLAQNVAGKAPLITPMNVMTGRAYGKVATVETQANQSASVHLTFAIVGGGNGANRADNYAMDLVSLALPGPALVPTTSTIDQFLSHRVIAPRNTNGFSVGVKSIAAATGGGQVYEIWLQSASSFRDPKLILFSSSVSVSPAKGPVADGTAVAWTTTAEPDVIYANPYQVLDTGISEIDLPGYLKVGNYLAARGNVIALNPIAQGIYLSWNRDKGGGRADFINHAGEGSGGFDWWNTKGTAATDVTKLMSLLNNGSLQLFGSGKGVQVTSTDADAGFQVNNVKFRSGEQGNAAYIEANNANIRLRPSGSSNNQIEFTPQGHMVLPPSGGADTMIKFTDGMMLRSNPQGVAVLSASNGSNTNQFITFRPQGDGVTATEIQIRANGNIKMAAANDTDPTSLQRRDSVVALIGSLASNAVNNKDSISDLDIAEVNDNNGVYKEGLNIFQTDGNSKNTPSGPGGALGNGLLSTIISARQSAQRSIQMLITSTPNAPQMYIRALRADNSTLRSWTRIFSEVTKPNINTDITGITIDSNGFVKKASPIAKLTAELPSKEEAFFWTGVTTVDGYVACNEEAKGVSAEKLGVGKYLIRGSLGWNQEGWKFEIPKDDNGNMLCFLESEYDEETRLLSVSVFSRKFDLNTGNIVAGEPMEIPEGRWIDLRLEMPYREPEVPEVPVDPPVVEEIPEEPPELETVP